MPGDGTRTGTTTNSLPARCLDLTRLISRVGRGPMTGIDRVEFAYLRRLLNDPVPLYLLVRTALGYMLLNKDGADRVLRRINGDATWGRSDLFGLVRKKASPEKRRAEADLRRFRVDYCARRGLVAMLARKLPEGTEYFNVGHSNLSDATLAAWNSIGPVTVLVHDTIPLDYPQFQRSGAPEKYERTLRSVSKYADRVICNTADTEARVRHSISAWGRSVETVTAHLGVEPAEGIADDLPDVITKSAPYFVALGTIEPRKNHALLLDLWERFNGELDDKDIPRLFIIGSRGWENEDVFRRLDNSEPMGSTVFELSGLSDAAVSAAIKGAAAVLQPSFAEGFGLPVAEAVALGTPVICSDLPVYREIVGNIPVYLSPDDVYSWRQSILRMAENKRAVQTGAAGKNPDTGVPSWTDHFNLVLKAT